MDQYNGKWPLSLVYLLKPLITAIRAIKSCFSLGSAAHGHFVCACAKRIEEHEFGASVILSALPARFLTSDQRFKKNLSREVKNCKKITHFSISMDILRVFWEFGWQYCKDQSTNKTRYRPKEVEFGIWFTQVQDVHTRRQIMQVSIKMLKLYCYDSRGCMLSRSSDTPSFFRGKFWIWADFASTLKWVFIMIPPDPKLQITSSSIVSSSSL